MNRAEIQDAIVNGRIEWLKHSLERMMERGISREVVKEVLTSGEIIENYPDDKPFPIALFLGWMEEQPIHVVATYDSVNQYCFVITAYKPDLEHFEPDFKIRRKYDYANT